MKEKVLPNALKWLVRLAILLFSAAPVYATLIIALTPYGNLMEPQLYPKYFAVHNFVEAFRLVGRQLFNSYLYSILSVVIALGIAIPPAYIMARYTFKFKKTMLFGILLTQMMAGIIVLPSLYKMYSDIGLINTGFGLVITLVGINLALTVWLLLGFFATLPREVEEAAITDGASFTRMLLSIVVPTGAPGIAVSAIFVFINTYNEFVTPLFLITTPDLQPLTMKLYSFLSDTTVRWHLLGSASILGLIPPVLIFLFSQKYIIKGITSGAVKS